MRHFRPIRLAATAVALSAVTVGVASLVGPAAAGAATTCTTVGFGGVRLIDWDGFNPKVEYSADIPVSLPPAQYSIEAHSNDQYPARVGVTQTSEVWELQFLDAGGNVIATSGVTGDLPDQVAVADWEGSLGTVTLPTDAVAVRAHHRPDAHPDGSANSVNPISAVICGPDVEASTTVAPTTAPPTTAPPTTAPTTTVAPTTAPPTSASPTTAPVASSVLGETTVVATTVPTVVKAETLASTGTDAGVARGVGLVLLGLGVVILGVRGQRVSGRRP